MQLTLLRPWKRIFTVIVLLTTWAASGQSVFDYARGFAEQADKLLTDLKQGIRTFRYGVDAVEGMLKESEDKECHFKCPDGSIPKKILDYKSTPNGCGTAEIYLRPDELPHKEMNHCCNQHDICYGTCLTKKDKCDTDFRHCLDDVCHKKKGKHKELFLSCKAAAKVFHAGSQYLGCKAFKDAQRSACRCDKNYEL
ncbi:group XIIA secretory phospholipase A2-like [Ornithodoros turicata]|uniref:group XIIA secretory phospholipase A2-like n=1 Tax=Ornithodoros turicata TaxID=34597 RepID=UPI0031398D50